MIPLEQVGCGGAAQKMLVGRKMSTPWVSGDCTVHRNALNAEPHLTFREHQILELVAVGCSAKQIALEINIAPRTVERHIENVRLKLNARNRAHLITQAMHLGLLVIETPSADEPTLFELR